jgi:hypothetical protein
MKRDLHIVSRYEKALRRCQDECWDDSNVEDVEDRGSGEGLDDIP